MTPPQVSAQPSAPQQERSRRFQRPAAWVDRRSQSDAPTVLVESPAPVRVQRRDRSFRAGLVAADLVAAVLVASLNWVWFGGEGPALASAVLLALVPAVNAANGLYRRDEQLINKSTLEEAPQVLSAVTIVTVLAFLLESALLLPPLGAMVVGATWAGLLVSVLCARVVARALVRDMLPPERCLVIGDHEHGRRLAVKLTEEFNARTELVGVLPAGSGGTDVSRLADIVERADVHRVLIAGNAGTPQQELETIQAAKALGVKVSVVPRVLEVVGSSAHYDYVDGLTVLGVPRFGLSHASRWTKRGFDLAGSSVLFLMAAPVMAVVALAVKFTSPGPILFRQTRIGRDGEAFSIFKFRSMYIDAEERKDDLRDQNEADGLFKIADDPRITSIGKFLRRTSLDELPQILNVLRGEMSLVGPRPLVPDEDRMIRGWHRRRLSLTPGMTGPWQVLGSARIPLREMVTIDYLYVANWSLWGDVKILLRTIGAVFARRGR